MTVAAMQMEDMTQRAARTTCVQSGRSECEYGASL